ncbi:MAG: hypothetical protein ACYC5M_10835 [Anaerolineae bacterium]
MTDPDCVSNTADLEARFFAEAEEITVAVVMLREMHEEIDTLIQARGWGRLDGLRILLAQGLAYSKGQSFLQADDAERERMARYISECDASYAVLKFEAFHLMRDNQVLEMREAAARNARAAAEGVLTPLRQQVDRLSQECFVLKQELREARQRLQEVERQRDHGVRGAFEWFYRLWRR